MCKESRTGPEPVFVHDTIMTSTTDATRGSLQTGTVRTRRKTRSSDLGNRRMLRLRLVSAISAPSLLLSSVELSRTGIGSFPEPATPAVTALQSLDSQPEEFEVSSSAGATRPL